MTVQIVKRTSARPGAPCSWLQTDRNNWQWKGLLCFMVVRDAVSVVDLANGETGATSNGTPTLRPSGLGDRDVLCNADQEFVGFTTGDATIIRSDTPMTMVVECHVNALSGNADTVVQFKNTLPSAAGPVAFSYSDTLLADFTWGYSGAANGVKVTRPTGMAKFGERHYHVIVYDGGGYETGASWTHYLNGRRSPAVTATFAYGSSTNKSGIGDPSSGGEVTDMSFRQARVYDWQWSYAHAREFYRLRGNIPTTRRLSVGVPGRVSSLAYHGGLAHSGGLAGQGGGLAA